MTWNSWALPLRVRATLLSTDAVSEALAHSFERLAVFPLPHTVFFPGMVLPLHVFEDRYRTMIGDVVEAGEYLAVVMIQEDGNPCSARPPLYPVATLGRVQNFELMPDGRSNFLLEGLARVELGDEVEEDSPYRRFHAEVRPSADAQDAAKSQAEIKRVEWCLLQLLKHFHSDDERMRAVQQCRDCPELFVDVAAACFLLDPALQQEVLSISDFKKRAERVGQGLSALVLEAENDAPTVLN